MDLETLIKKSIEEDISDGDHTTLSIIDSNAIGSARLYVKEAGVLAGIDVAHKVFDAIDRDLHFHIFIQDGENIYVGDIAFEVIGRIRSILQAERLVLNFMQRMSGIATKTRQYVEKVKDTKVKILDTRKTTPCNRIVEKMAVKIGGGFNHRFGLYDMILIKDNHIDFSGGIEKSLKRVHKYLKDNNLDLKIEIEVRNIEELQEVISVGGVHRIMLDNFSISDTEKAVKIISGQYEIESSGGITLDNVRDYALTGVDYISVGDLTHHINSLDMSLKSSF